METHNVHPVNTYKDHNYITKDVLDKKNIMVNKSTIQSEPPKPSKVNDQLKATSSSITLRHLGTKVAFSIEKDLHIIVTTVKDSNTNKVIRQIPPEETIDRLKLLNNYHKQPIINEVNFQPKFILKDF